MSKKFKTRLYNRRSSSGIQKLREAFYSKNLLLDHNHQPLSTVSDRKIEFYISKDLVEKQEAFGKYSSVYKLKFKPKNRNIDIQFATQIIKVQCVCCGNQDYNNLSVHHVIPYWLIRILPKEEKNNHGWCVVVCSNCNKNAEKYCRELYTKEFNDHWSSVERQYAIKHRSFNALFNAKIKKWNIPEARVKELLNNISLSWEQIPATKKEYSNIIEAQREKALQARQDFVTTFIEKNGGITEIKNMFRKAFLRTNPKYLPYGFLEVQLEQINQNQVYTAQFTQTELIKEQKNNSTEPTHEILSLITL